MGNEFYLSSRLRPYQSEFVENFLNGSIGRDVLLVHHVGMGASFAAIEIVRRHVMEHRNARVLVLGAAVMLEQWFHQLAEAGIDSDMIDRYRYRELQDSATEQHSVWDRSHVVLMRTSFDRYEDVLDSLSEGNWTLVVAIDSHRLIREGNNLLESIRGRSLSARLLLLSPHYVLNSNYRKLEPLSVVRWQWKDIAGQLGRDSKHSLELKVRFLEYELDEAEAALQEQTLALRQFSGKSSWSGYVPAGLLLSAFESSPAAFEDQLRRYRNRLAHAVPHANHLARQVEFTDERLLTQELELQQRATWFRAATKCLEAVESLNVDHKISAFSDAVESGDVYPRSKSVYLLTEFRPTMLYVQSRLEEMGIGSIAFQGSTTPRYLHETQASRSDQPSFFLATNAMLNERLDFGFIDRVVFYDPPRNEMILHRLLSQLGVFQRTKSLSFDVLIAKGDIRSRTRTLKHIETVASHWGFVVSVDGQSSLPLFT